MRNLKSLVSFLLFLLVIIIFFDNSVESALGYKTKLDEIILMVLNGIYLLSIILKSNKSAVEKSELYFIIFVFALILSSILNSHFTFFQSSLGVYFLIKSLTVFFLIKKVGITKKYFNKIILVIIGFSFLNFSTQLLQLFFTDISNLSFGLIENPAVKEGFTRAGGIFGNANRSSLLFILTYLLLRIKNYKILNWRTGLISLGILLSASNLGFLSFLLVLAADIVFVEKKRRLIMPLALLLGCLVFYLGSSFLFRMNQLYELAVLNETYFRLNSYLISFEVLKKFPLLGVGPGFYGGSVAAIFGSSPYHDFFGTFDYFYNSQEIPNTIDAFWPHFWAEVGIVGLLIFLLIIFAIVRQLLILARVYNSKQPKLTILLFGLFLFSGISTFSVEATFSSILIYIIIAGLINQYKNHNPTNLMNV